MNKCKLYMLQGFGPPSLCGEFYPISACEIYTGRVSPEPNQTFPRGYRLHSWLPERQAYCYYSAIQGDFLWIQGPK